MKACCNGCSVPPCARPFDGRDLRAVLHDRQGEARIDPPAVDQNGAGAALAVVAALFGPGEVEMVTQRVEQRGPRRDGQLARHAVDMERDRVLAGLGIFSAPGQPLRMIEPSGSPWRPASNAPASRTATAALPIRISPSGRPVIRQHLTTPTAWHTTACEAALRAPVATDTGLTRRPPRCFRNKTAPRSSNR